MSKEFRDHVFTVGGGHQINDGKSCYRNHLSVRLRREEACGRAIDPRSRNRCGMRVDGVDARLGTSDCQRDATCVGCAQRACRPPGSVRGSKSICRDPYRGPDKHHIRMKSTRHIGFTSASDAQKTLCRRPRFAKNSAWAAFHCNGFRQFAGDAARPNPR